MREPLIIANWKMHKTYSEARQFADVLLEGLGENLPCQVWIAPPFPYISSMVDWLGNVGIQIGAQNMHDADFGAFTGEISGRMIQDIGGSFVLIGHSERRRLFHETSEFLSQKVKKALSYGLKVVFCIGETLAERRAHATEQVLERQIIGGLGDLSEEEMLQVTLAYEPIWAIGTGVIPTMQEIESAHRFSRWSLLQLFGEEAASQVGILYGGSVTPENSQGLMKQEGVDGVLVGGASLDPKNFLQMIGR